MNKKVQYALLNGSTVHISEVQSGLECNCICPSCGERLVAKKGNQKIHHFAHMNHADCAQAYESALHLGVKRVLEKERRLLFPATYKTSLFGEKTIVKEQTLLEIERLLIEKRVGQIIPDILIQIHHSWCFIEIFVTHQVDSDKLAKIEKMNIAALEIDFSHIDREVNDEVIRRILLEREDLKSWLYNAKIKQIEKLDRDKTIQDIIIGKIDVLKITLTKYHFDSVFGCPLLSQGKRLWCVSFHEDCCQCEHMISHDGNAVYCDGRYANWKRKNKELVQRLNEETAISDYQNTQAYLDSLNICPRCGNMLTIRNGRSGQFLGCQGYPWCKFTRKI